MTKDLIIVGASGFGHEIAWVAKTAGFNVLGFLDDNAAGEHILGKVASWQAFREKLFFIAIGNPRIRKKVFKNLVSGGEIKFATIISPNTIIAPGSKIGAGSVVMPGAIISVNSCIGDQVIINLSASIGHDVTVGNFVSINPQAAISGKVTIEEGAEIGTNSTVVQNITIKKGALVTAGALAHAEVLDNQVLVGNPARAMRKLDEWNEY
ncbi:MAG: acetyltransferase [Gammaproteobacteria bacterium]|jgi:sugar O-acyltransferase (sialic acid O-acetyltransferase NeuD family)|nr:acetyltransferase [Gammaproteobacteria bacterium]